MATRSLMMRGNFIALIASVDDNGNANQVVPVPVDYVTLKMETGLPVYDINGVEFSYDQVLHVRSHAPVGALWGCGIVERYRDSLSGALYEQKYGTDSYRTGGVPSIVVQVNTDKPTSDQVEAVAEGWQTGFGNGQRRPAVIGKNMTLHPIEGWTPHDQEWVLARGLTIAECALMCGLRPEDLGATIGTGSSLTYANRSDDAIQRIIDSYGPWSTLIEQAWSDLLPAGAMVNASPDALLRMSIRERLEVQKLRQEIGVKTDDEIKEIEEAPEQ